MPVGKAVIGQSGGPTAVINKSLVGFIKGYPTAEHLNLIKEFGPSKIHRMTFKGVK